MQLLSPNEFNLCPFSVKMTLGSTGRHEKEANRKQRSDPAHQNTALIRNRGSDFEMSQLTFISFDM